MATGILGGRIEPRLTRLVEKYRELTRGEDGEEAEVGEVGEGEAPGEEEIRISSEPKKQMLDMIADHLKLFEHEVIPAMLRKREKERLSAIGALVPRHDIGDRLQRYEASLERSIDRTLGQLERLQRLRMGHPVPPTLKVDVSR